MLEIKLSIRGVGADLNLSQFLGNSENVLGNCRFHVNADLREADAWFVIEDLESDDTHCATPDGALFFLTAETSWPIGYYSDSAARMQFIKQFDAQYTCHDLYLESSNYSMPFLPWMINANHGVSMFGPHERDVRYFSELASLPKPKVLSVFCSAQSMTASHRMRLRFVEQLKAHFGDQLDWYGNGIQPLAQKWDGIAPYKYTIVLENHAANNVITEKIQDAFLGLSYPIYWGASNVDDYFDADGMTQIDIADLRGSISAIEKVLAEDPYERAQESLLRNKSKVVGELMFLNRMAVIAQQACNGSLPMPKKPRVTRPIAAFEPGGHKRIATGVQRAGRLLQRAGQRINF